MGFLANQRNGEYILNQVNKSIRAINSADIGYYISDHFTIDNTITDDPVDGHDKGRNIIHERTNMLHRYFEDLQGVSGSMSPFYNKASAEIRWHIRQLNLLCHEFESWALSYRKEIEAPEWTTPSQLMCWLNAPRFELDYEDYELFGIDALTRHTGGVYVGVNKAVGKHHWEVFHDEGRDSRIDELTTTTLRAQTEAAGDFDIEWGRDVSGLEFKQKEIQEFREWLIANGFDPNDKSLTLGHPQIGQVNLQKTFGSETPQVIWSTLSKHLDVYRVSTHTHSAEFDYHWSNDDYIQQQVNIIGNNR